MRKLHRGIGAGALALPLVLGATGVAAADSFQQGDAAVGPDAAVSNAVSTNVDGSGNASYDQQHAAAGPDGAVSHDASSTAGDHDGPLGLGILGL